MCFLRRACPRLASVKLEGYAVVSKGLCLLTAMTSLSVAAAPHNVPMDTLSLDLPPGLTALRELRVS